MQLKIEKGCELLLSMPLDTHGNKFLGVDSYEALRNVGTANVLNDAVDSAASSGSVLGIGSRSSALNVYTGSAAVAYGQGIDKITATEMRKLLKRRLTLLMVKPLYLMSLLVISKAEIVAIFAEILATTEKSGKVPAVAAEPIHKSISEYLVMSEEFNEDDEEDIYILNISPNLSIEEVTDHSDSASESDLEVGGQSIEYFDPTTDQDWYSMMKGNINQMEAEAEIEQGVSADPSFPPTPPKTVLPDSSLRFRYEQFSQVVVFSLLVLVVKLLHVII